MEIYRLKNQVARVHTEKKEKTKITLSREEFEDKEVKPKSRDSFPKTLEKKPMTPIKKRMANPESSYSKPPKVIRNSTYSKREPILEGNPQLQIFNPLIQNNYKKATNLLK